MAKQGQNDNKAEEEREFTEALSRYKRKNQRPYPTLIEILNILRDLGWRRVEEEENQ